MQFFLEYYYNRVNIIMLKLSPRLQIVYDMVPPCGVVADVGCDHGYLTISLLENGVADSAIAMDINAGPLKKAEENIRIAGFSSKVSLRISNGLQKLEENEADVICICGMGGTLIGKIIVAEERVAKSASTLIIEPQSDYFSLRKTLMEMGFVIIDEDLTCEENKIYPIIKLYYEPDESERVSLNEAQLEYGPVIIKKVPELLIKLLDKNQQEYSSILRSLESKDGDKSDAILSRMEQLRHELDLIAQVRNTI